MPQFRPFSYADVVSTGEAVKGARSRNALAQQQLDPMSTRNQLQREQLTGARQGNVLAQQRGQREQTTFDQQQQESNTKLLYQALTEISQNPAAADFHVPKLQEMGILRSDFDYQSMSPEEIQSTAAEGAQAIGKSLGMGARGRGPSAVQEYDFYQNLTPDNKKTFLQIKRAQPNAKFVDTGPTVDVFDPITAQPIAQIDKGLAPKDQPSAIGEAATVKADVALASKKKAFKPKAKSTILDLERQTSTVNRNIDEALATISPFSTGAASWFKFMPNSEAGKLDRILGTIKANVGFDKLQRMRDNSPTGGALGQVSELENKLLQAVNGALDPTQRDLLETNLSEIKRLYTEVLAERKAAYNTDYGDEFEVQGVSAGPSQEDLEFTAEKHGITVEEVKRRMGQR